MKLLKNLAALAIVIYVFATVAAIPFGSNQNSHQPMSKHALLACQGLDNDTPSIPRRIVATADKDECIIVLTQAKDNMNVFGKNFMRLF